MPIFLVKFFGIIEKAGWKISLIVLAVLFIIGWAVLSLVEPVESRIAEPEVYWWWFLVTTTTVGYGDYAPISTAGRIMASLIMISGIGSIGIIITQMAQIGSELRRRIMEGQVPLKQKDHIVIIGYHQGKTENLVEELRGDSNGTKQPIVLCFKESQAVQNPMPEEVEAVKGNLTSPDLLSRACVETASRIIADGDDDNETLIIALSVSELNRDAHIVAAVYNLAESSHHLEKIRSGIECVPQDLVPMICEAAQDPGITRLYGRFMSNLEGHSGYRYDIPEGVVECSYGDLFVHLKRRHGATLLAAAESHSFEAEIHENPDWDFILKGGMSVYYVAPMRLSEIDFSIVGSGT